MTFAQGYQIFGFCFMIRKGQGGILLLSVYALVCLDLFDFLITETVNGVVIYHANCLHHGVADGRADELEATFGQVFAQLAREVGLGGNVGEGESVVVNGRAAVG